eukprot:1143665-Pelagomonas_calceolata.AAC.3
MLPICMHWTVRPCVLKYMHWNAGPCILKYMDWTAGPCVLKYMDWTVRPCVLKYMDWTVRPCVLQYMDWTVRPCVLKYMDWTVRLGLGATFWKPLRALHAQENVSQAMHTQMCRYLGYSLYTTVGNASHHEAVLQRMGKVSEPSCFITAKGQ